MAWKFGFSVWGVWRFRFSRLGVWKYGSNRSISEITLSSSSWSYFICGLGEWGSFRMFYRVTKGSNSISKSSKVWGEGSSIGLGKEGVSDFGNTIDSTT